MRKKLLSMSVSRKTLVLLLIFVMAPLLVLGGMILARVNRSQIRSEQALIKQRLSYVCQNIEQQMDTVKEIADDLSADESIYDIAKNGADSEKHFVSRKTLKAATAYNDSIAKVQIISGGKVVWQYSPRHSCVLSVEGNEEYAALIDERKKSSFWSPLHILYQLKDGEFNDPVYMVTFYTGIYETEEMRQNGVLAIHLKEETIRKIYENFLYGEPTAAWMVTGEGKLVSATMEEWRESGIPEELSGLPLEGESGMLKTDYQGEQVELFWEKCGDWDYYLVQMNAEPELFTNILVFILLALLVFVLLYLGYTYFYRLYVIRPLESLTEQMEKAKDLKLRQESLPARGDEIGRLTNTFQSMLRHIDQLIDKVYVEKIKTQEAEQEMMLSQINPHFLYNTLDSIRWNALSHGDQEVGRQMEALSIMLRNTLNVGKTETTVRQEMQTIESYCYLLQARFRKDIEVSVEVDPAVEDYHIPKLLIQPLVENAYKHGLENSIGLKRIWVKVHKFHNRLLIYVADNGVGCDRKAVLQKLQDTDGKDCFALKNIRDRIHLAYGENGVFRFVSWEEVGTIVKLILPFDAGFTDTQNMPEKREGWK